MNGNNDANRRKALEKPVSREDVETAVKRAFGPATKTLAYHVKSFSEEKVGMMGMHRRLLVTIQREDSPDRELQSFFLKSIPYGIEKQAALIEESNMFYKETNFYRQLVPELLHGLKDRSWSPRCHLIKEDALLFEDLHSRNFGMRSKFLDLTSVKSALRGLAKLHAASILAEKRLGRSLLQLHPKLLEEALFVRSGGFSQWHSSGTEIACVVAEQLGLDPSNVPRVTERIFEMIGPSKKWRNVVCHGDVWSYNLLFDDAEPLPRCVLVDFQLVRYAPPVVDILQLFYLTTSRAFREEHERALLGHYHEALCEALRENNEGLGSPSLDDIVKMYEELRIVGVVTACLYFPVNLVDGKLSAELMKDSDGFATLMYGDRLELVLEMMQKDQLYREKLSEIVTELVQRSEQLLT